MDTGRGGQTKDAVGAGMGRAGGGVMCNGRADKGCGWGRDGEGRRRTSLGRFVSKWWAVKASGAAVDRAGGHRRLLSQVVMAE